MLPATDPAQSSAPGSALRIPCRSRLPAAAAAASSSSPTHRSSSSMLHSHPTSKAAQSDHPAMPRVLLRLTCLAFTPHPFFHLLPVEVRQNSGHSRIQLKRNRLTGLDRSVKAACERRIFNDGNACPTRLLANLCGQQVTSLRQHLRRLHRLEAELQSYRIMRRVRNDYA